MIPVDLDKKLNYSPVKTEAIEYSLEGLSNRYFWKDDT
jgi:hypothetical protein